MQHVHSLLGLALLSLLTACGGDKNPDQAESENSSATSFNYPTTQMGDVSDTYFGKTVKDPYRWLEEENAQETKNWVDAQIEATFSYLDKLPQRDSLASRMRSLWNYEKRSAPFKEAGKYFYYCNDGLQNQNVLYVQDDLNPKTEAKVFIDPNTFSKDGTVSMAGLSFSKDGKYAAYGIADGGSDWRTYLIKEVASGKTLSDSVKWVKFSGASWYKDGFFYSRYADAGEDKLSQKNEFHQVFYHKVGTSQSEDQLIFADRSNPKRNFYAATTEDERYIVISASESTSGNALFVKELAKDDKFTAIVKGFDNDYSVIDNTGSKLLVRTNYKAPNYRLVEIDVKNPKESNWKEIIPTSEQVLEGVSLVDNKIIARYIKDGYNQAKVFDMNGKQLGELKLPEMGTIGSIAGKRKEDWAFLTLSSFLRPSSIYKINLDDFSLTPYWQPKLQYDPADYETKQVFYKSKDGTKVPMFLSYKKGMDLKAKNPTLLYGYGGFNISVKPRFSISNFVFMEQGGIYASANIRGGGEYGEAWHKAGTKMQKQNVFDDFIAAAEYLIAENYTSEQQLAIEGRSNGGLLIGACMTQRPDLYAVALPRVGVLDMLRYHKFTIGWAWATDYGTSADSKEQFEYLLNYSPVHNADSAAYPATLIMTADHDDRVVPAHSFKFAAALQANNVGQNPTLIRIDKRAGHGAGKATDMVISEEADKLAFTMEHLGMDFKQ